MAIKVLSKNFSGRNLIFSSATWLISYVILQTLLLHYSFGLAWELALQDSILTNVLMGISAYAMINLVRFYRPRFFLRLVDSIGMAILAVYIVTIIAKKYISTDAEYEHFVEASFFARCIFAWMTISLFATSASLWFHMREQQEIEKRKTTSEHLAREAELSKLRQQLQPHFLFNSLNSISALAGSKPEQARKMIQQLSDFLRGTLRKDDQQLVPLSEELEHLQLYLDIEKVRFGHRLMTHIENDERSLGMKLPPLLLQPIVENAIKFGLYDTTGEIVIRLITIAENNYLVIRVENPFDAATAKPRQGTGFGLTSVQRRLYLLFARQDLLSTSQDEITFTTTIKIPQTA